jgi:hypothetical protein
MRQLLDCAAHAEDPETLRARLAVDGYLFFRGLLPREAVEQAGTVVRRELASGGWTDPDGRPVGPVRAVNARDATRDPAYLNAAKSAAFNRIPYLRPLRRVVRSLLGADAFSYPVKVLRTVYPEALTAEVPRGRYVHQDYRGLGVNDLFTTWVPLMPIPRALGGLAVLPGSHLGPPPPVRVLRPEAAEAGWASTDFEVGDVLLFHGLTSHAALPNRAGRLRVSQDCRWQPAAQSAPARMLFGPRAPEQGELFHRLLRARPWWEPVPASVVVAGPGELGAQPPWSRFFPVHQAWAGRANQDGRADVR